MNYAENIQLVINTLERVEARGSENWERLLASVQHLKKLQKEMSANETDKSAEQQRNPEDTADAV